MQPFVKLRGVAAPLLMDDIDTDQITPIERDRVLDVKAMLFSRWKTQPDFVLNRLQFKDVRILVSRENFGCGSSRESAVWALIANGITCVIARSIADLFRENCLRNGVLPIALPGAQGEIFEGKVLAADGAKPFTVDLTTQLITSPDDSTIKFDITPAERTALLEGLDDIGLTLKHKAEIEAFEAQLKSAKPWLQTATRQS